MTHSILIVDDDEVFRNRLMRAFQKRKFSVWGACDYDSALAIAQDHQPLWALIDLKMPGPSGLQLVREFQARFAASIKMVVLTGFGSIATAVEAIRLGAHNYLTKPADVEEIISAFSTEFPPDQAINSAPAGVPSLARTEWEHIQRTLDYCEGNISQAARLLGIHRRSLQRKLSKVPPAN